MSNTSCNFEGFLTRRRGGEGGGSVIWGEGVVAKSIDTQHSVTGHSHAKKPWDGATLTGILIHDMGRVPRGPNFFNFIKWREINLMIL